MKNIPPSRQKGVLHFNFHSRFPTRRWSVGLLRYTSPFSSNMFFGTQFVLGQHNPWEFLLVTPTLLLTPPFSRTPFDHSVSSGLVRPRHLVLFLQTQDGLHIREFSKLVLTLYSNCFKLNTKFFYWDRWFIPYITFSSSHLRMCNSSQQL